MDNPYLNTLMWAVLAVAFILATSFGLGALARWIVKKRGAQPGAAEQNLRGLSLLGPLDRRLLHLRGCAHARVSYTGALRATVLPAVPSGWAWKTTSA